MKDKGSSPPPAGTGLRESGNLRFLLAVVLPLFAAMAIAKAFAAGTWEWGSLRFPIKLAIISWHDMLFVAGWVAIGGAALYPSAANSRRAQRIIRFAFLVISALMVFYAMADIWIYQALRMPLTYPLLMMTGEDARSSIDPYLNVFSIGALIAGPLLYLAAVRVLLLRPRLSRRSTYLTLASVVAAYGVLGFFGYSHWYAGGPNEALASNPHWAFLKSAVDAWRGGSRLVQADAGPASYKEDFLTFGQRAAKPPNPRRAQIKNVLVVVLESTGTQFLGVYHSQYPTTPNLQAQERNSLIFNNFYSNDGYTLQSYMPLVLSLYPGVGWEIYASSHPHLSGTSAAETLHERGYRTAYMTGGALDFRGSRHFFDHRGFDLIRGVEDFQKAGVGTMVSSWGIDDPPVFDALFDWIGQAPGKPFFAILWTQQTHHPYTLAPYQKPIDFGVANPASDQGKLLNLYLNDLRIADEQLGRLFAFLQQRNLADDTLVVITGDHGEGFGFPHPWTFHGTALYQESVNVPCIFWNPRIMANRGRSDVVGAHVDLNPTLFDLLGLPAPAAWQGTSLFDPTHPSRAYFSCNTGNLLQGLRDENRKFIYNLTLGREELYDLDADPEEQRNIAQQRPQDCREYRQRLSAWGNFEHNHLKTLIDADPK
jgi:lipoteichoic acid synthase